MSGSSFTTDGRTVRSAHDSAISPWRVWLEEREDEAVSDTWLLEAVSRVFEIDGLAPPWVWDICRDLGAQETVNGYRYQCPCCENYTMEGLQQFDTCPVCRWVDDLVQLKHPDTERAANRVTLAEARKNYGKMGAKARYSIPYRRPVDPSERPKDGASESS